VRLVRFLDFVKKAVPLNDDVFNFFYEALPGYEEVGRRRVLLGCWGSFQDPDVVDYRYENMDKWGRAMFVTGVLRLRRRSGTRSRRPSPELLRMWTVWRLKEKLPSRPPDSFPWKA
jgi:hypothetical protein